MATSHFYKVVETDADFEVEVLQAPVPVIVHFLATWCMPCKALDPIVDRIAQDFHDRVKVFSLDIDNCPDLARKYGVKSVPSILVFKNGEMVASRVGLTSREIILQMVGLR
jgi:thioredoxin 1